jgi:type III pantothenate kinase
LYLIVDIGNTLAKFFLYNDDQWVVQKKVGLDFFFEKIETLIANYVGLEGLIYSDVSHRAENFFKKYSDNFPVIKVGSGMRLPYTNDYKTPDSLGSDRIVLVAAACQTHFNTNVLIIDLGTCITYDFLSSDHVYRGGAISPGFEMRYKALQYFSGSLPLLESKVVENPQGKSTKGSIHAGVYFGIVDEIKARIDYYDSNYDSLTVILTGGDANKLPKTLKNSIFAHSNFLAEGMLHLLKLNIDS